MSTKNIFLHKNICCGYSLESPQWDDSNKYPQHIFSWRTDENYPSFIIKYPPYLFHWGMMGTHWPVSLTFAHDYFQHRILFETECVQYELPNDKTNKMTCAPSEDTDQPGHPLSLISLRCPHKEALGPHLLIMCTGTTLIRLGGCPGWSDPPRLIWVFVGHTGHFVGFVMWWLCYINLRIHCSVIIRT